MNESNRDTRISANRLIFNNIIAIITQWLRLLSGLLLAVQIRWLKNLQLLEIIFSYFNTLCRGKSLTLHLCKMYEREVCFLRWSQLRSPKSSKIRSETDPCIIKAQVARYQYYKDSASANNPPCHRRAEKNKFFWITKLITKRDCHHDKLSIFPSFTKHHSITPFRHRMFQTSRR